MKEKIEEAKTLYGSEIVNEVLMLVSLADPDGCYSTFRDMGMDEHMECVEFLYFE